MWDVYTHIYNQNTCLIPALTARNSGWSGLGLKIFDVTNLRSDRTTCGLPQPPEVCMLTTNFLNPSPHSFLLPVLPAALVVPGNCCVRTGEAMASTSMHRSVCEPPRRLDQNYPVPRCADPPWQSPVTQHCLAERNGQTTNTKNAIGAPPVQTPKDAYCRLALARCSGKVETTAT